MTGDMPYITILSLYILSFNLNFINSRTSTLWKLNAEEGKIVEARPFHQVVTLPGGISDGQFVTEDDPIFNIITSTVHFGQSWTKHSLEYFCTDCQSTKSSLDLENKFNDKNISHNFNSMNKNDRGTSITDNDVLDCGKEVNFTFYDNLPGVANRRTHSVVPEPEVAQLFSRKKRSKDGYLDFDVNALERRLKKAKREKPKSIQLYNQIGNFWRIKGDAYKSIECFRRALAVSPHNAEVLLNLARVLYAVKYYEDAIYVAQRSLDVQPPDRSAWQQYFTLGELCKVMGRPQEAISHFRVTLELRPDFERAAIALKEIETQPGDMIHMYTFIIIICLVSSVLGVLLVVVISVDQNIETELVEPKSPQQRHFNRAMAMRSLRRMSFTNRPLRGRRSGGGS